MELIDKVLLGCVPLPLALVLFTARRGRTAPGTFFVAVLIALGMAAALVDQARDNGFGAMMAMIMAACALGMTGLIMLGAVISSSPKLSGPPLQGDDLAAIEEACRVHDEASRHIEVHGDDRRQMPRLARLLDSFVTTDSEIEAEKAIARKAEAARHLTIVVPAWHKARTDELIDRAGARGAQSEIEKRLAPLEEVETAARQVHALAVNAISALDGALSNLASAKTYETIDLVSNNKGLAALSTAANSSARSSVEHAKQAITRLSEGTSQAIREDLLAPDDTFDLIVDMAFDMPLDFMSIFTLSKLSDAEDRCRTAREPIARMEAELRAKLETATAISQAVRDEIARFRLIYTESALEELAATARIYMPSQNVD